VIEFEFEFLEKRIVSDKILDRIFQQGYQVF